MSKALELRKLSNKSNLRGSESSYKQETVSKSQPRPKEQFLKNRPGTHDFEENFYLI